MMSRAHSYIVLSTLVVCAACGPEQKYSFPEPPSAEVVEPPANLGEPTPQGPGLEVAPTDAASIWRAIPIRGKGPAGGKVVAVQGAGPAVQSLVDQNGDFCIDVPLRANALNEVDLQAMNTDFELSPVVRVEIEQAGAPELERIEKELAPANVAHGDITSNMSIDGDVLSLVDEDWDGEVFFTANRFDTEWIVVPLSETTEVDLVRIVGTADCYLDGVEIKVAEAGATWKPYYRNDNINTPILYARPQGERIKADYLLLTPTGWGCGFTVGYYGITEIQVYGPSTLEVTLFTPQGPTCASTNN